MCLGKKCFGKKGKKVGIWCFILLSLMITTRGSLLFAGKGSNAADQSIKVFFWGLDDEGKAFILPNSVCMHPGTSIRLSASPRNSVGGYIRTHQNFVEWIAVYENGSSHIFNHADYCNNGPFNKDLNSNLIFISPADFQKKIIVKVRLKGDKTPWENITTSVSLVNPGQAGANSSCSWPKPLTVIPQNPHQLIDRCEQRFSDSKVFRRPRG